MGDVRLNMSGVRAVLKSSGVKSLLKSETDAACARCNSMGGGYMSRVEDHASVSVGQVFTYTDDSKTDNLRNNTLKKGTGW